MQCSEDAIVRLFYNVSSSLQLLFIFIYVTSILFSKIFNFLGGNIFFQRNQDEYDFGVFSDEEAEGEEEEEAGGGGGGGGYYHVESTRSDHLLADTTHHAHEFYEDHQFEEVEISHHAHDFYDEVPEVENSETEENMSAYSSPVSESGRLSDDENASAEEEFPTRDNSDSVVDPKRNPNDPTEPISMDHTDQIGSMNDNDSNWGKLGSQVIFKEEKVETKIRRDENHLIFAPSKLESKKIQVPREKDEEEIFGDSCTNGSTSKSSSEWRSSINCSGTEDPFSSSSRRSCPNWESYTVFQKYDEEMLFLDRISAQKLSETESLRSIQACPRSISERIVHKISTSRHKKYTKEFRYHNAYHQLESAYVAQICLTWEALNWNYKYFQRLRDSRHQDDPGCPAYVAQQFQQFLVLLQRYVENEPFEHGRRPEIYARMRSLAPKLLQVPEYRDSDEDQKKEEGFTSRISSESFLVIMEEAIRTFMGFLKADKQNRCQILAAFFKRNRRGSVDPTLLLLLKKINKKKKLKLKDIRRSRKCLRKRKLKETDEMEILMALIDLKVVSRVLRMTELNDEQLHWCEDKMSKVRISDGKLHRDSSPLFFPAHC